MTIVKVTEKLIYCYHDYSFMVFNRQNIIGGARIIGYCWAAGKGKYPIDVPVELIKKDTCYHQILVMLLMELVKLED